MARWTVLGGVAGVVATAIALLTWAIPFVEHILSNLTPPRISTSTREPRSLPRPTPNLYVDAEGCFYDVTNDSKLGATAHEIRDQGQGRIQQEFVATFPFIRAFSVVIGYEGAEPDAVKLLLRDGIRVLGQGSVKIVNNAGTQLRFDPPVQVEIGRTYTMEVINTSGEALGVYMYRYSQGKPDNIGSTLVLGEVGRTDGHREEALTGCVKGAIAR